ncbi:hypothetical protein WJX79_001916 [Trebouxia sp. C0005]
MRLEIQQHIAIGYSRSWLLQPFWRVITASYGRACDQTLSWHFGTSDTFSQSWLQVCCPLLARLSQPIDLAAGKFAAKRLVRRPIRANPTNRTAFAHDQRPDYADLGQSTGAGQIGFSWAAEEIDQNAVGQPVQEWSPVKDLIVSSNTDALIIWTETFENTANQAATSTSLLKRLPPGGMPYTSALAQDTPARPLNTRQARDAELCNKAKSEAQRKWRQLLLPPVSQSRKVR